MQTSVCCHTSLFRLRPEFAWGSLPPPGLKSTPLMLHALLPRFVGPLCAAKMGTTPSGRFRTVSAILMADVSMSGTCAWYEMLRSAACHGKEQHADSMI